jgi:hypothetical protein
MGGVNYLGGAGGGYLNPMRFEILLESPVSGPLGSLINPQAWFAAGFDEAWFALSTASADCLKDIGGGATTAATEENQLMNTIYLVADLGVGNGGSMTIAIPPKAQNGYSTITNTVVLNADAFFNPTQAPSINQNGLATTQNLVLNMADSLGLSYSSLTIADFQAITLLHELGHELGGLPDDSKSSQQSVVNSKTIANDCFPDLKAQ